jgi:hypothetical protein
LNTQPAEVKMGRHLRREAEHPISKQEVQRYNLSVICQRIEIPIGLAGIAKELR